MQSVVWPLTQWHKKIMIYLIACLSWSAWHVFNICHLQKKQNVFSSKISTVIKLLGLKTLDHPKSFSSKNLRHPCYTCRKLGLRNTNIWMRHCFLKKLHIQHPVCGCSMFNIHISILCRQTPSSPTNNMNRRNARDIHGMCTLLWLLPPWINCHNEFTWEKTGKQQIKAVQQPTAWIHREMMPEGNSGQTPECGKKWAFTVF